MGFFLISSIIAFNTGVIKRGWSTAEFYPGEGHWSKGGRTTTVRGYTGELGRCIQLSLLGGHCKHVFCPWYRSQ